MLLLNDNYTLNVKNIEESIYYYQRALKMQLYSHSSEPSIAVMYSDQNDFKLTLIQVENPKLKSIDVSCIDLNEAINYHTMRKLVFEEFPLEARYTLSDIDGNIINIYGDFEKIVINLNESSDINADNIDVSQ